MKQILFATANESKVKRFQKKLLENNIEMLTLKDIDTVIEIEENGSTAIENALIKARAYEDITGLPTLAMDDNLYLENVPSTLQPGVYVRRVNGKRLTDEEMIKHYTNLVQEYGLDGKLVARWVHGLALVIGKEEFTYSWSNSDFYLITTPSGSIHPGYPLDSISINKKLNKYFTELTEEDKLSIQEDETHAVEWIVSHMK